jgi:hypothetical protein
VYKLSSATLGLVPAGDRRIAVTVPTSATITVLSGDIDDNGWLEIDWDGQRVSMFAIDLRERGELIESTEEPL